LGLLNRGLRGLITLTVKGGGIDMTVDLPPNISTQSLLEQLTPLLEKEWVRPIQQPGTQDFALICGHVRT
jgi:hypothetical protein